MSNISAGQPGSAGLPSSSSSLTASGATATTSTADAGTSSGTAANQTPPSSLPLNTQQLLLVVSERQARVVALPSQQMIGKCILSPSTSAVRADVVYMKTSDAHCLYVLFTSGQVCVYALPSLRIIKELELEALPADFRIESNVTFNLDGHLAHFASHSELAKYCANSALHDNLLALKPTLAKDIEIPEPPKQGFIKAIFSVGSAPFEKDEVFANNAPQPTTSRTASAKQPYKVLFRFYLDATRSYLTVKIFRIITIFFPSPATYRYRGHTTGRTGYAGRWTGQNQTGVRWERRKYRKAGKRHWANVERSKEFQVSFFLFGFRILQEIVFLKLIMFLSLRLHTERSPVSWPASTKTKSGITSKVALLPDASQTWRPTFEWYQIYRWAELATVQPKQLCHTRERSDR